MLQAISVPVIQGFITIQRRMMDSTVYKFCTWRGGGCSIGVEEVLPLLVYLLRFILDVDCKGVVLEEMHAGRPKAYEISCSHSGIAEDASLMECHTVAIISKVSKDGIAFQ
jgi:hypothetical protein